MRLLVVFIGLCVAGVTLVAWSLTGSPQREGPAGGGWMVGPAAGESLRPDRTEPVVRSREVLAGQGALIATAADHATVSQPAVTAEPRQTPAGCAPTSAPADLSPTVRWADDVRQQSILARLEAAREALAADPRHPRALRDELVALCELGRWPEAGETLARLIQLEPEDAALRQEQAVMLIRQGRWAVALPALREVIARTPDDVDAWIYLAAAQQTLGHLGDARRSWTRVLELRPGDAEAHVHRGQVQLALHDWQAAVSDFEQALVVRPDDVGVVLDMSQALAALGREEEARARVREVLEQYPRHVPALNRMAELCWRMYQADPTLAAAELDGAVTWWERSLAVDANQPAIRKLLETALRQQK